MWSMKHGLKGGNTIHLPFLLTQHGQWGDFLPVRRGGKGEPSFWTLVLKGLRGLTNLSLGHTGEGTSLFALQSGQELSCEDESNTLFSHLRCQVPSCSKSTEVDAKGNQSLKPWHQPHLQRSDSLLRNTAEEAMSPDTLGWEMTCSIFSLFTEL